MAQLLRMQELDTHWFHDTLAAKRLSQRGLAKLLDCNASSVNRLINGKRAMRFEEAERLAVFLGVPVSDVISRAGISVGQGGRRTRLVGYIDGSGEAHVEWAGDGQAVPILADLPAATVAIQYRTAMSDKESMDGWVVYVEPPDDGRIDHALHRWALVSLESGMTMLGFLRRGYVPGKYNISNFTGPNMENVGLKWATPVLLVRP